MTLVSGEAEVRGNPLGARRCRSLDKVVGMIVCQCQNVSDRDIDAAINWMRAADAGAVITPGRIYRALGKRAECGGCMPQLVAVMRRNANLEVPVTPTAPRNNNRQEQHDER